MSCRIHHVRPAFEAPAFVDSIQAYYHKNMTSINEDTTSIVGINRETLQI
jgi:hypothetical protein